MIEIGRSDTSRATGNCTRNPLSLWGVPVSHALPLPHFNFATMLPLFGTDDRKRRNINLGGRSTSSTHTSILDEARLRREERQSQLKQQQSAIRIQSWWRGKREARVLRVQLRHILDQDPAGISGLRAVVLIGQDEESLEIWSHNVLQSGESECDPSCFVCTQPTLS